MHRVLELAGLLFASALLAGCTLATSSPERPDQPVPTPADLLDASVPEPISDVAWRWGTASWGRDPHGDWLIEATMGDAGRPYRIEFYGCTEGRDCTDLRFVAETGTEWTAEELARWNAERRFGKAAALDDGGARVEMNAVLQGGVTAQNLDAVFDWWHVVLAEFDAGPDG